MDTKEYMHGIEDVYLPGPPPEAGHFWFACILAAFVCGAWIMFAPVLDQLAGH